MAIVVELTGFKGLERNGSEISAVFGATKESGMSGILHEGLETRMSVNQVATAIERDTYAGNAGVTVRQAGEAMGLFI